MDDLLKLETIGPGKDLDIKRLLCEALLFMDLTCEGKCAMLRQLLNPKGGGDMRGSRSLVDRMIRAAKLDVALYEEVEADTTALPQALAVVVIAQLSIGLGSAFFILWDHSAMTFLQAVLWGVLMGIAGWLLWSLLVYYIGTRLFRGPETESNYFEVLRTVGFSASPGALGILGFIPLLGWLIRLAIWVWMLVAMVIAVRQALDFTTGRAVATCIAGFIVWLILFWVVGAVLGIVATI